MNIPETPSERMALPLRFMVLMCLMFLLSMRRAFLTCLEVVALSFCQSLYQSLSVSLSYAAESQ